MLDTVAFLSSFGVVPAVNSADQITGYAPNSFKTGTSSDYRLVPFSVIHYFLIPPDIDADSVDR